jgi:hypothetical protein
MSTSIIHVLKLIGPSAIEIADKLDRLQRRRKVISTAGFKDFDWGPASQQAIEQLCERLIKTRYELPIAYYAQYVDSWSVAGSQMMWLRSERRRYRDRIWTNDWSLWYHRLPDQGWLKRRVSSVRRKSGHRSNDEMRWHVERVAEAAEYAEPFNRPALVLSMANSIGGSRHDDEYRRCLLAARERRSPKKGSK